MYLIPKGKGTKAKINKWDYIKLKSFCTAKENIDTMKRQPMEWEKTFPNDATDKGLISQIYKPLIQVKYKKKKKINPVRKWAEDLNRQLLREYIKMVKKHMKSCSV